MAATQIQVAEHLGISRRLVADLAADGTFRKPLKLDQCRRAYIERLQASAAGRQKRERPHHGNEDRRETARDVLKGFALPRDFLVPWLVPPDRLLSVPEYEERAGLERGAIIDLMIYGLPLVPPAPGEQVARVSWEHAERHRFLLGALLHKLGGPELIEPEGGLARLAPELHRLRGVA
jgi:predicted DNA-binding transcriptional regulator AlpA